MKKVINNIVCSLLLVGGITACNKVMDTKPLDRLDADQAYSSTASYDAVLAQIYADVLSNYSGQYASMEAFTPNGIRSDLNTRENFPTENGIDEGSLNGNLSRFTTLRRINLVIKNAEESSVLSDASKVQYVASAKFFRALTYFDMTRKMGRFVPVNEVFELVDTAKMRIALTSGPEESYKYVMDDLNAAIEGLPPNSLSGRINKYAALAYKSRIALQAFAYTNDRDYLDQAIEAGNEVINSGRYALTSNYGNMFLFEGKDDREIILNRQYLALNTTVGSFNEMIRVVPNINNDEVRGSGGSPILSDPKGRSFEGWASFFPTQDLVDQYLVIDEMDGKAKSWYQTSQYVNNVVERPVSELTYNAFTANPAYDGTSATTEYIGYHAVPERLDLGTNTKGDKIVRYAKITNDKKINEIMYNKRDKRFYATVVHDSSIWLSNELVTLCVQGNLWAGVRKDKSSSWYTTVTGYYWRKAVVNADPRVYYNNKIDYQFVLVRLGEVYLNVAEAYLLKGNYNAAREMFNKTRMTHGELPASTASAPADVWEDYIRERRVEMVYEGDLYWTYLRWGKYGGYANYGEAPGAIIKDLDKPVNRILIKKDRKEFFIGQVLVNEAWDRNFTTKRYLYPIPRAFRNSREAYGIIDTQNPGWQ